MKLHTLFGVLITLVGCMASSRSGAAVISYVFSGDILSTSNISAETFTVSTRYNDKGKVLNLSLYFDNGSSPVWIVDNTSAELLVFNDGSRFPVPHVPDYFPPLSDIFGIIGESIVSFEPYLAGGIALTLSDSAGNALKDSSVPTDIQLSEFDGRPVQYARTWFENALYAYDQDPSNAYASPWIKIGVVTSVCSGNINHCVDTQAVPLPAALFLMLSGMIMFSFAGITRKSKV